MSEMQMIGNGMLWRPASADDIDTIVTIEKAVHTLAHERSEIFAEKYRLFSEGCLMLMRDEACLGYGVSHPWRLGDAPAIDAPLGRLPTAPDCLFIHDVALRHEARGLGAGQDYVRQVSAIAGARGLPGLALISVYGTVPMWERCGFRVEPLPASKLAPYGDTACYMTAPVAQRRR